jgi:hypothetical protein
MYKFAVTVQSKGFDEAPDCVLKAVHLLIWASKASVLKAGEWQSELGVGCDHSRGQPVVFNECLGLGFMKGDKINVRSSNPSFHALYLLTTLPTIVP